MYVFKMSILKSNKDLNSRITYKSLIIGAGSIGFRHLQILKKLGHEIRVVSKRKDIDFPIYADTTSALNNFKPNYVIISNDTNKHINELKTVLNKSNFNKILVEKPLTNDIDDTRLIKKRRNNIYVGYNLRYHPFIKFMKNLSLTEVFLSANVYVGQYLPNWRPNRNYKDCYSSDSMRGGGVLFELSHELDYMLLIFGKCVNNISLLEKISDLDINCNDSAVGIMQFENCKHVSYNFNLLDKTGRREIILNTDKNTYKFDLARNILTTKNDSEKLNIDKNETYKNMHLDILNNNGEFACSLKESIEVLNLIEQIQKS